MELKDVFEHIDEIKKSLEENEAKSLAHKELN